MPCPIVTTVHDITFRLFPEHFLPKDRFLLIGLCQGRCAGPLCHPQCRKARVVTSSATTSCTFNRIRWLRRRWLQIVDFASTTQELARDFANKAYGLLGLPYILSVVFYSRGKTCCSLLDAFALVKLGLTAPPHLLVVVGKRGWKTSEIDDPHRQIFRLPTRSSLPECARRRSAGPVRGSGSLLQQYEPEPVAAAGYVLLYCT